MLNIYSLMLLCGFLAPVLLMAKIINKSVNDLRHEQEWGLDVYKRERIYCFHVPFWNIHLFILAIPSRLS